MPNTAIGLLIFVAFLLPGFAFVLRARQKLRLFAEGKSQIEIVLQGLLYSFITHLILMLVAIIVVLFICLVDWSFDPISWIFTKEFGKLVPQTFKEAKAWHGILCMLYLAVAIAAARYVGAGIYVRHIGKVIPVPGDIIDTVGFLELEPGMRGIIKAWLENGCVITGILANVQSIPDTTKRTLTLIHALIVNSEGEIIFNSEEETSEPNMLDGGVTINTNDIKMMALINIYPVSQEDRGEVDNGQEDTEQNTTGEAR